MRGTTKNAINTKPGVYRLQNLKTGKFYIGSSLNLLRRYWQHRQSMLNGSHKNPNIKEDSKIYGRDVFCFGVVEYCDKNKLDEREQYFIDTWKPEYNRRQDADNPKSGWDEQAKEKHGEKLKIAWIARKARPGFKEKHAAARRGIPHSEETKKKYSEVRKGKKKSPEWKEKIRQGRTGTKLINGHFTKVY